MFGKIMHIFLKFFVLSGIKSFTDTNCRFNKKKKYFNRSRYVSHLKQYSPPSPITVQDIILIFKLVVRYILTSRSLRDNGAIFATPSYTEECLGQIYFHL